MTCYGTRPETAHRLDFDEGLHEDTSRVRRHSQGVRTFCWVPLSQAVQYPPYRTLSQTWTKTSKSSAHDAGP
jgi:hypothetical protein